MSLNLPLKIEKGENVNTCYKIAQNIVHKRTTYNYEDSTKLIKNI